MKKADRRFWTSLIVIAVMGACVIIGLKIAMDVLTINNNLRKEELSLLRETVVQISELKNMIGQMQTNFVKPEAAVKKIPVNSADQETAVKKMPVQPGIKQVEGVTPGTNPILGRSNAPVLMVEFSDFECPYSKKFYKETFPQLEKEYISTGKVKFAYRDYTLPFHHSAQSAAIISRCAAKKNKFWEIWDKLSSGEKLDRDTISMHAKSIGLDKDQFDKCLNDREIKDAVKKDLDDAAKFGVSGTPVFFINGRMVVGAVSFEAFKKVIEEELKKCKK